MSFVDRMKREFRVEVNAGAPQVSYREDSALTQARDSSNANLVVKVSLVMFGLNLLQNEEGKGFGIRKCYRRWCGST